MQPTGIVDTAKAVNPLKRLQQFGQSVWLDYIRRSLITSGELQRLIDEDGLRGITSNPSIFEKAISGSTDYADLLKSLASRSDLDATLPTCFGPYMTAPGAATAMSAWKCRPIWLATPRARFRRHGLFGSLWPEKT